MKKLFLILLIISSFSYVSKLKGLGQENNDNKGSILNLLASQSESRFDRDIIENRICSSDPRCLEECDTILVNVHVIDSLLKEIPKKHHSLSYAQLELLYLAATFSNCDIKIDMPYGQTGHLKTSPKELDKLINMFEENSVNIKNIDIVNYINIQKDINAHSFRHSWALIDDECIDSLECELYKLESKYKGKEIPTSQCCNSYKLLADTTITDDVKLKRLESAYNRCKFFYEGYNDKKLNEDLKIMKICIDSLKKIVM